MQSDNHNREGQVYIDGLKRKRVICKHLWKRYELSVCTKNNISLKTRSRKRFIYERRR